MIQHSKQLLAFLSLLIFGTDVAYVTITAVHLQNQDGYECLISYKDDMNWCNLSYVSGGVSAAILLTINLLIFWNSRWVGLLRAVLLSLLASWHSTIASLFTLTSLDADDNHLPAKQWRTAVWALMWAALGLAIASAGTNALIQKPKPRNDPQPPLVSDQPHSLQPNYGV